MRLGRHFANHKAHAPGWGRVILIPHPVNFLWFHPGKTIVSENSMSQNPTGSKWQLRRVSLKNSLKSERGWKKTDQDDVVPQGEQQWGALTTPCTEGTRREHSSH
jgi:hypothetical protein